MGGKRMLYLALQLRSDAGERFGHDSYLTRKLKIFAAAGCQ